MNNPPRCWSATDFALFLGRDGFAAGRRIPLQALDRASGAGSVIITVPVRSLVRLRRHNPRAHRTAVSPPGARAAEASSTVKKGRRGDGRAAPVWGTTDGGERARVHMAARRNHRCFLPTVAYVAAVVVSVVSDTLSSAVNPQSVALTRRCVRGCAAAFGEERMQRVGQPVRKQHARSRAAQCDAASRPTGLRSSRSGRPRAPSRRPPR